MLLPFEAKRIASVSRRRWPRVIVARLRPHAPSVPDRLINVLAVPASFSGSRGGGTVIASMHRPLNLVVSSMWENITRQEKGGIVSHVASVVILYESKIQTSSWQGTVTAQSAWRGGPWWLASPNALCRY